MKHDAVEIRDLIVRDRRDATPLRISEFTLPQGEAYGVYDASTAGATLFLSCVSGVRQPEHGTILIDGQPMGASNADLLSMGVVLKEGGVFPDFTVSDNLKLALRFSQRDRLRRRDREERLDRTIRSLKLEPWTATPARNVPVGVRQRLNIACALVHAPRLLIADDPWGQADRESRELIERALGNHCAAGNTLLFASPREQEIVGLATEICLFDRTSLIARGTIDHLRQYVETEETICIRVQEGCEQAAAVLRPLAGVRSCTTDGDTVLLEAARGTLRPARLAEHIQAAGLELLDMGIRKPGLARIYTAVVGDGNPS